MNRFCAGRYGADCRTERGTLGGRRPHNPSRTFDSFVLLSLGDNTVDQTPNATELLASFIVDAGGGMFVCIRRTAGLAPPVVVFKSKEGGPEHAISLFELSPRTVRDALQHYTK